jgi:hypothetical protein
MALLDARFVDCDQQGAWIMEDASLSLQEAGEAMVRAAAQIQSYANSMCEEGGPCGLAGEHMLAACTNLEEAGFQLAKAGTAIKGR